MLWRTMVYDDEQAPLDDKKRLFLRVLSPHSTPRLPRKLYGHAYQVLPVRDLEGECAVENQAAGGDSSRSAEELAAGMAELHTSPPPAGAPEGRNPSGLSPSATPDPKVLISYSSFIGGLPLNSCV